MEKSNKQTKQKIEKLEFHDKKWHIFYIKS